MLQYNNELVKSSYMFFQMRF